MKKKLAIGFLVLIAILVGSFSFYQNATLRPLAGKLKLENLKAPVSVFTDDFGIPHIKAQNAHDAYMALGYVLASERLFQMELMRRIVTGTLSEVFGKDTLEADILLRKLHFKKNAADIYAKNKGLYDKEAMPKVVAFIAGINQYIKNHALPLEFQILRIKPGNFTPEDILAVAGYMSLTFAEGIIQDLLFYDFQTFLPPDKLKVLLDPTAVDVVKNLDHVVSIDQKIYSKIIKGLEAIDSKIPFFHGSNSWVLAPSRTKSEYPILANDPHIGYSSPGIFMEAHLEYPGLQLYGHFIPLVPFAILGRTPHSAWAITMSEMDDMDVYIEKFNPENADEVMYKNKWVKVNRYQEVIKVKGEEDKTIDVVITPHGPLIDDTTYGHSNYHAAIAWTVYHPHNNIAMAFHDLPYAKSVNEFKNAVAHAGAPGLNLSFVNDTGDIAWWVTGKVPRYPEGVLGNMALAGHNGKNDYLGYLNIEENPHEINPKSGVIVTANYKPEGKANEVFYGYWQPSGRYFRIKDLLAKKERWTVEELKTIQNDSELPYLNQYRDLYLKDFDTSSLTTREEQALALIKKWDGVSSINSVETSIWYTWASFVHAEIFKDEMSEPQYKSFAKVATSWHNVYYLLNNREHSWWDDVKTPLKEVARDILLRAFKLAINHLETGHGDNIQDWHWGKLHTFELKHLMGKVKPLNKIFNIGPHPVNGSRNQINNMAYEKYGQNFDVTNGPATRRLIDMASPLVSWGILPGGNSGHPFSEHFDNQNELFRKGEYRHELLDWNAIKKYPELILD